MAPTSLQAGDERVAARSPKQYHWDPGRRGLALEAVDGKLASAGHSRHEGAWCTHRT